MNLFHPLRHRLARDHTGYQLRGAWRQANSLHGMTCGNGPDPRKVDTSGVNYATLASIAEVSASKTSGAGLAPER